MDLGFGHEGMIGGLQHMYNRTPKKTLSKAVPTHFISAHLSNPKPVKRQKKVQKPKMPRKKHLPTSTAVTTKAKEDPKLKKKGKGGSSCHQCKSRRNFAALTYCTSNLDRKNKSCRKKFCEHCLKKFYKEPPAQIRDKSKWKCPSCRKICCCAACRRRKLKDQGIAPAPKPPADQSSFAMDHHVVQHNRFPLHSSNSMTETTSMLGLSSGHRQDMSPIAQSTARPPPRKTQPVASFDFLPAQLHMKEDEPTASRTQAKFHMHPNGPAVSDHETSRVEQFHSYHALSQKPLVRKHIKYILCRKDITESQKVVTIADLLRMVAQST